MKLKEIANDQVITLDLGDPIDRAIVLMEKHNIHHLPVVDEENVVGIVSDRDLLTAVGWLLSHDRVTGVEGPAFVGPTNVADAMSSPVQLLSPEDPIEEAARLMVNEKIGAVPLSEDNRLVGIVAETDILRCYLDHRTIGQGTAWRFRKVADFMAAHVFSVKQSDSPQTAYRLMRKKQVRHLPVVHDDRLLGIVSDRDVRKTLRRETVEDLTETATRPRATYRPNVGDIMSRLVETVEPSTTLAEAADRMLTSHIGALPVTEEQALVGIITETDLLKALVIACEV